MSEQNQTVPLNDDLTNIKIHIDAIVTTMRDEDGRVKTRELALAVTNLQQARMWIEEHQRLS